jgi:hypothetical protein
MSKCVTCKYYAQGNTRICGECYSYKNYEFAQTSLNKQEGGQHYKDKAIQPIVYIHANGLGFCEGNVVKYITRHKEKNGAEDIRKVIHYCELLLELEYKNASNA